MNIAALLITIALGILGVMTLTMFITAVAYVTVRDLRARDARREAREALR